MPFLVLRSSYGEHDETTDDPEKAGRGRIIIVPRRCNTDSRDLDIACPIEAFIEHVPKQTAFALALVLVDVGEIVAIMRAWLGRGKHNAVYPVMLQAHARFLNNVLGRYGYRLIFVHFMLRGAATLRDCFQMIFGEFNENYCKGEDREASYCYKYNQQNKGRMI